MEDPAAISLKVNLLLEEIGALKIQKDDSTTGDPERATYFQCELHRKFVIIDWIKSMADRQLDKKEKSSLSKTWTLVSRAREDAKASKDDLDKMLIPSGGGWRKEEMEVDDEPEPFPFMDLPEFVVREEILRNLTCPLDKLNVMKVIPSALQLMRWDLTTVRFESAMTILIQQNPNLMNWRDLYNLSKVTPYLQKLIKKDYEEKAVLGPKRILAELTLDDILPLVDTDVDDPQWADSFVFPRQVLMEFGYGDAEEGRKAITDLGHVGGRILDCYLVILVADTPLETLEKLAEILALLPQVSLLQMHIEDPSDEEWEWKDVENVDLPDLPLLKLLSLEGNVGPQFHLVKRALLENYGGKIHDLMISEYLYRNLSQGCGWDDNQKVQCPHLSNVRLEFRSRGNVQQGLLHLNLLAHSPLKIISLYTADRNIVNRLPGLLTFISNQFGTTLEQLELRCNYPENHDPYSQILEPYAAPSPTWILDLKFPKLNHLTLDNLPNPNGWAFLLQMPALEKLDWNHVQSPSDSYFKHEDVLSLSFFSNKTLNSNIWKLLPHLTQYSIRFMKRSTYGVQLHYRDEFSYNE